MTADSDELAIRAAFARRRPASVPPELARRVHAVSRCVRPLRPLPVRLAVAVAPWAAVAVVVVALAFGPRWLAGPPTASAPGTSVVGAPWTPAEPGGGMADQGPFGLPWVPLLPVAALVTAIQVARRRHRGQPPVARPREWRTWLTEPRRNRGVSWPRSVASMAITLAAIVLAEMVLTSDPIVQGSVAAPGPELAEIRDDGVWRDEQRPGYPDEQRRGGPNYVYRVRPGDGFSTIISVRNAWPVPITVLGIDRSVQGSDDSARVSASWRGLGLLRDARQVGAAAGDVAPFHPVTLGPGEEVTLVVAWLGGPCADPAAPLPPIVQGLVRFNPGVPLVYEVLGWRRVGDVYPPYDMTVPGRAGCDTSAAPP